MALRRNHAAPPRSEGRVAEAEALLGGVELLQQGRVVQAELRVS